MLFFGVILLVGVELLVVRPTKLLVAVNHVVGLGDTNGLLTPSLSVLPFP